VKWGESGGPLVRPTVHLEVSLCADHGSARRPRSARRGAAASEDVDATVEAVGGGDRGTGGDW